MQGPCPLLGAEKGEVRETRKLLFIDVSKAHLYATIEEDADAYVALPPECTKDGVCGRLDFWLYGMRPASKGWEVNTADDWYYLVTGQVELRPAASTGTQTESAV